MGSPDPVDLFEASIVQHLVGPSRIVDRPWLREKVDNALDDPGCRVVLVTGEPGAGKSTFLAGLAALRRDWPRYFIRRIGEVDGGPRAHDGSLASFLTVVGLQMAAQWPHVLDDPNALLDVYQEIDEVGPNTVVRGVRVNDLIVDPFRTLARELIIRVYQDMGVVSGSVSGAAINRLVLHSSFYPQGLVGPALVDPASRLAERFPARRVVVLVDGLDELRFRTAGSDVGEWLTSYPDLPPNVRFVVASRHNEARLDALRRAYGDALTEVSIDPRSAVVNDDLTRYAQAVVAEPRVAAVLAANGIHPDRFVRIAVDKAAGNFQYLTFLVKTLEQATDARPGAAAAMDLEWLTSIQDLPVGLDRLYAMFLVRVRNRVPMATENASPWDDVYRPLLGTLAVARAPLTAGRLASFANLPGDVDSCRLAVAALGHFLDGTDDGGYRLYHTSVADFLHAAATRGEFSHLYCEPADANTRITDHAFAAHARDGSWKAVDPYLRAHLAAHAAAIGRLDVLIDDPEYLIAAEPAGLTANLASADRTAPIARLYRQVLAILRDGDEAAALAHMELYAHQADLAEFADRVACLRRHHIWSLAWMHWRRGSVRQVLGEQGPEVAAIVATRVHEQLIAVSGDEDGTLRVWDLLAGQGDGALRHGDGGDRDRGGVSALAVGELANGEPLLISGGRDGTVRAWNLATRMPIGHPMGGVENAGVAIAVGSVGSIPVGLYKLGSSARVWNLVAGSPIGPPAEAVGRKGAVGSCGGRVLLAVGNQVFDATTGLRIGPLLPSRGQRTCAVAVGGVTSDAVANDPVGETAVLAISDLDGILQLWDPVAGVPRSNWMQLPRPSNALAVGRLGGRSVLAVGIAGAPPDGVVWLFDLATEDWIGEPIIVSGAAEISALAIGDDDGQTWLAASYRRYIDAENAEPAPMIQRWQPSSPERLDRFHPVEPIIRTTYDVDSLAMASVAGQPCMVSAGAGIAIWDLATGQCVRAMSGETSHVDGLALADLHGRAMAICATGETVRVWDVENGTAVGPPVSVQSRFGRGEIVGLGTIDLGGRVAVVLATRQEGIRVWDLVTGEPAGAGLIAVQNGVEGRRTAEPTYVHSMAVGSFGERRVVALGTSWGSGVLIYDLDTGVLVEPPHPGHRGQVQSIAIVQDGGRPVVVSGTHLGTLRAWTPEGPQPSARAPFLDLDDPDSPLIVVEPPQINAMAVVVMDGRLVAVHSGLRGIVQVTDLAPEAAKSTLAFAARSVAVTSVLGRSVVVCGGEDLRILDVGTGHETLSPPTIDRRDGGDRLDIQAMSLGELDGRPIGVYARGRSVGSWYLDNGANAGDSFEPHEARIVAIAAGLVNERTVVVTACDDLTVQMRDLETGDSRWQPLMKLADRVTGLGVVNVAGADLLIYARPVDVRASYLTRPAQTDDRQQANAMSGAILDETPPSPLRVGTRLTGDDLGGLTMCLGTADGAAIVVSGHASGSIDIYTIDQALRVGERFGRHPGRITAVTFGHLRGRAVIVSGGEDGTVCVWDPARGSLMFTVKVLSWVNALALAPPEHLVIGTQSGTIGLRLQVADEDADHHIVLPVDIRGSRQCARHTKHIDVVRVAGEEALRVCIKGMQVGSPQFDPLAYGQGHCYVLAGRIVVADGDLEDNQASGVEILLRHAVIDPRDSLYADQYDGCHFGLVVADEQGKTREICCYSRADRDKLNEAMTAIWPLPPRGA